MKTNESTIKTLSPSILQYSHLFAFPVIVLFLPAPEGLKRFLIYAFWILEFAALAYSLLMIWLNSYTVTVRQVFSQALDFRTLVRTSTAVPIESITDIYVRQNPLQALLGIGNLEVDTAGGDGIELVMVGIENPVEIQNLILGLKGDL